MASKKLQGTEIEFNYFPDPIVAENYLKRLKDETLDFSSRIDLVYAKMWELEEKSKEAKTSDYKIGDLLYSESYDEVFLYDGDSGVFADGIELKSVNTAPRQNRPATLEEIKVFFKDCSKKLKTNVIYIHRLKDALTKCNYSWDPNTFEIFKNQED